METKPQKANLWKAALLALLVPILVWAYAEGPPDAHTGGFGEPTCIECHGTKVNSNGGNVTINGLPQSYSSGATYSITVTISDATARRWGFQLSARTLDAKQAGTLIPGPDKFTQFANPAVSGFLRNPSVQYIEHTLAGTRPGTPGPVSFVFNWTAPDISRGAVEFDVAANAANNSGTNDSGDHIYSTSLMLPPQAPGGPTPAVPDNAVVNNASFALGTNPLAPGTIAAIFGTNLNDGSSNPFSAFGPDGKLLTTLGGASVMFNTISAPMFSSFAGQLNVQIPFELAGSTSASVVVTVGGQSSPPKTVPLGPSSPGIFAVSNDGKGQGAIQIANTVIFAAPAGSISGAQTRPAKPGEFLTIYCTGLGAVSNPPATGAPAGANPLSATTATPQVTIGGIPATVTFSGLSPGFVGLYQINAQVPPGTATSDAVPLLFTIGEVQSNTVTIAVAP